MFWGRKRAQPVGATAAKAAGGLSDGDNKQKRKLNDAERDDESAARRFARAIGWEVARRSVSSDPSRPSQEIPTPKGLAIDEDSSSAFVSANEDFEPSDGDDVRVKARPSETNKTSKSATTPNPPAMSGQSNEHVPQPPKSPTILESATTSQAPDAPGENEGTLLVADIKAKNLQAQERKQRLRLKRTLRRKKVAERKRKEKEEAARIANEGEPKA